MLYTGTDTVECVVFMVHTFLNAGVTKGAAITLRARAAPPVTPIRAKPRPCPLFLRLSGPSHNLS